MIFSCRGNGTTRRPRAETYDLGHRDILALNDVLADKKFLMGDHMTEVLYTCTYKEYVIICLYFVKTTNIFKYVLNIYNSPNR